VLRSFSRQLPLTISALIARFEVFIAVCLEDGGSKALRNVDILHDITIQETSIVFQLFPVATGYRRLFFQC